jgi:hypothetical protein
MSVVEYIDIQGVLGSNLIQDTGYPERGFFVLFLSPFKKVQD